ncbi:nuclease-related domain-containing protein [Anaerotardibacter muris]|uniref:nuclease-related domain-containing protein n=1 Tax=Anaerotardibacter muris TaxID=2941505 RepID=UPI0020418EE5|nr:nuclease-related domain-containing protein [Anaerotardibacter muris]
MQEIIINILFIAVLVVIGATLAWDVYKKRKRLKTAQREEVELADSLETELPEGFVVLKDIYLVTKLGRSRVDFVILSPYGIFALEYRQLYIYIRADEEISRWTYAPGIKGKPFTSPLYQSKVHLLCIEELIGDKPGLKTYPMVAFPTIAEIELKNPSEDCFVGLVSGVIPFIEKWSEGECLTAEEVSAIAELLQLNSEKVLEMEKPEVNNETPEEYKAFIPGDFREDDEDEDDEEYDDEDEEEAEEDEAQDAESEEAESNK